MYRVTINIRRKGEGFMSGVELKTEYFDSMEELLEKVNEFILDEILQDEAESEGA